MSALRLRPWTVKQALPFVRQVHRRLPRVQGAMWAVSVRTGSSVVGCALVGNPARVWMEDNATLCVLRVAVFEGQENACSMLYAACSRAAKAMGAENLVTYTEADQHGASLKASGWVDLGMTDGGEYDRPSRQRRLALNNQPKRRWAAPWSALVRARPQASEVEDG